MSIMTWSHGSNSLASCFRNHWLSAAFRSTNTCFLCLAGFFNNFCKLYDCWGRHKLDITFIGKCGQWVFIENLCARFCHFSWPENVCQARFMNVYAQRVHSLHMYTHVCTSCDVQLRWHVVNKLKSMHMFVDVCTRWHGHGWRGGGGS